jgi:hypothetical protein
MGSIQITTNNLILMIKEIVTPITIGFTNPIRKFTLATHLSKAKLFKETVGQTPKGYLHLVITFSLFVDFSNFNTFKKKK